MICFKSKQIYQYKYYQSRFPENQSYIDPGLKSGTLDDDLKKYMREEYEPKDLGPEVYEILKKEHKEKRQVFTRDYMVLFDFYKLLKKNRANRPSSSCRPPSTDANKKRSQKMSKFLEDKRKHEQTLIFYLQCDSRDVQFTLKKYSLEEEDDINISKFYNEKVQEEHMKQSQKQQKKKVSKEVMDRLYKKPEFEKTQSEDYQKSEKRNDFVKKIIILYKFDRVNDTNFRKPDILYNYWLLIEEKQNEGVEMNQEQAKDEIDQYFQEKLEILCESFYRKNGYYSDQADPIVQFWKNMNEADKIKYQLNFESAQNVKDLLEEYLKQKKDQENIQYFLRQQEKERQRQEQEKKKPEKDKQEKHMGKLSQPKDRLKVGKTILELKKMYPNDKVLRKMLLQEFKETRVAKHPQEYDIVDSDEENMVKIRHQAQKNGVPMSIEEIEIPQKMKEEEIAEFFEQQLDEFYSNKQQKLREEEEKKKRIAKQERLLKRFMEQSAEKYLDLRKRRFSEKIQSLNQYLSALYKEAQSRYKEATNQNFPHKTYGESKRLKNKSFPSSFKKYFFACIRGFVRRKYANIKDKENRIAFWAPPNGSNMCRVHRDGDCPPGCIQQTQNKRVFEQSRLLKDKLIREDRPQTSVWDHNGYLQEKQKILMTFSDAKECTFQPSVCTRMPNKLKNTLRDQYNWTGAYIDKKGSFEHFVEKFGKNFRLKPKIYRFGVYKQAIQKANQGLYQDAYKAIAVVFNIKDLKREFRDPNINKQHTLYTDEKLGLSQEDYDKLPDENFNDQSNRNFLWEIYDFIKKLEAYETDLERAKKHLVMLMDKSEKPSRLIDRKQGMTTSYNFRRTLVKNEMCPLGPQCPSQVQRWPETNTTSVTPLGANCLFAHHPYELKFSQEIKAKQSQLKKVLDKINLRLDGQSQNNSWNPSGNSFITCKGCGKCNQCLMLRKNIEKLTLFQKKAQKQKMLLTQQPTFQEKKKMKEEEEQNLNKKLGYLSRASALCKKERFTEAFKVIVEAVDIIKKEIESKSQEQEKSEYHLKKNLGLDPEQEYTAEQIFLSTLPQNQNPDDLLETQKLHKFGMKTGIITNNPPDVNEFLNLQIEKMYLKIEKSLKDQVKDIDGIKGKIEKLEEEDDKATQKQKKFCKSLLEKGYCIDHQEKKCPYYHKIIELDMVKNEKKIFHLQQSMAIKNNTLRDSKPPIPWVSASIKDVESYQNTAQVDRTSDIKRLQLNPKKGLGKARSFKDHSIKTIYERDIDDLKTPVEERKKAPKY